LTVVITPRRFHQLAILATALLAAIVVTGAAVRLTGSGLGCPTWPRCTSTSYVAPASYHALVEFINRVVSALVGIFVAAVAIASWLRRPRRADLCLLAAAVIGGVVAQAVVGGLSVRYGLNPGWVMAHFLLSMLLLLAALVLVHRADPHPSYDGAQVRPELRALARLVALVASGVLILGTITTGTGPHAGDSSKHVTRFAIPLERITQLHADAALLLTGLVVATLFAVRLAGAPRQIRIRAQWVALCIGVQIVLGYVQYFLNLPAGVVEAHVAGATALWCAAVWLALGVNQRSARVAEVVDGEVVDLQDRPLAGQH
jgi:cytochrome c oxidase assembly protein subunit 15